MLNICTFNEWGLPEHWTVQIIFHRVVTLIIFNAFGQAKVSDLYRAFILHQNIPGSQVSVDVVARAQVVHALEIEVRKQQGWAECYNAGLYYKQKARAWEHKGSL